MKLFIRHKSGEWITFVHDIKELKELVDNYLPGRHLVIGDLSTFTRPMLNILLKFVEENSAIDIYTSSDLTDPVLLSRFVEVIKDPIKFSRSNSVDQFLESDKSYLAAAELLSSSSVNQKLRAPLCSPQVLKLLIEL